MPTLKEYRDNTFYGYFIKITGNLYDGSLATLNIQHDFPLRHQFVGARENWEVIVDNYTKDFSKVIDFEVIEHKKVCFVETTIPWEFEDSDVNYDMINNPEEDE